MKKREIVAQEEIDMIAEIDDQLDFVTKKWAQEIQEISQNPLIKAGSKKFDAECNKINKKYKDLVAQMLILREDIFHEGARKQEESYQNQFQERSLTTVSKTDEYGRPIGKKWVDGAWVDVDVKN